MPKNNQVLPSIENQHFKEAVSTNQINQGNKPLSSFGFRPTSIGQQSLLTKHTNSSVLDLELSKIDRDPNNINKHVFWDFEDVLGEPNNPRSVDM